MVLIPKGIDSLFGSGFFLVTSSSAKSRIEAVFVECLLEALGFHHIGVYGAAMRERTDALIHPFLVDVYDKIHTELFSPGHREN